MNDLFLRACRREPVARVPVWIMRQAGRYLPEYRAVRERHGFETVLKTPELAVQVTMQPVVRLAVDAAILFSDILVPVEPMGVKLAFDPGPILEPAIRTESQVSSLRIPDDPERSLGFVYDTIRALRRELEGKVPLIGFGGAPFTLAAYLVEGRGSKDFEHAKSLLYSAPQVARELLDRVTKTLEIYLVAQVQAGAQVVQIFDSWAGMLSREDYREFALPYAQRVIEVVRAAGVPVIYFVLNGAHLLEEIARCGADVLGLDWRLDLDRASRRLGDRFVLQGNLDPCVLLSTPEAIAARTRRVLEAGAGAPGHIFNLGHGILPATPVENAQTMVDAVRRFTP